MLKTHCGAPDLASLLDDSSAGELIPELARHGLQQLIELELAGLPRCGLARAHRAAARPPQRLPASHPDHPGEGSGAADLQTAGRQLSADDLRATPPE